MAPARSEESLPPLARPARGAASIRPMTPEDLPAALEIERASFGTPWSRESFEELMRAPGGRATVAAGADGAVLGYAVSLAVLDEVHLLNLAVAPAHRRRGLGAALYDETAAALRRAGARVMFLEVRPSNEAALALYRSRGLEVVGRRRRYYADNGEDAIVMAGEVE